MVLLGKHVWHTVDTLEASVSLAADRLLTDQLADLAATVQRFDGRPLMPAKWCVHSCGGAHASRFCDAAVLFGRAVREAAASVSANFSRGGDGVVSDDAVTLQRSVLQGCAAFLVRHKNASSLVLPFLALSLACSLPHTAVCRRRKWRESRWFRLDPSSPQRHRPACRATGRMTGFATVTVAAPRSSTYFSSARPRSAPGRGAQAVQRLQCHLLRRRRGPRLSACMQSNARIFCTSCRRQTLAC